MSYRDGRPLFKNYHCYNSRQDFSKFEQIIYHFCEGTPALRAAAEISENGIKKSRSKTKGDTDVRRLSPKITRQTVARHYQEIGLLALRDPKVFQRFKWWRTPPDTTLEGYSIEYQPLSRRQILDIRMMIYGSKKTLREWRQKAKAITGRRLSPEALSFVAILQDMSRKMNGISPSTFEMHLGRACLLASFVDDISSETPSRLNTAKKRMFLFLMEYFRENPFLWPIKITTKRHRQGMHWINGAYLKRKLAIEDDNSSQPLKPDRGKSALQEVDLVVFDHNIQLKKKDGWVFMSYWDRGQMRLRLVPSSAPGRKSLD